MLLTLSGTALSHCRGQPVFPQKRQHNSSSPGSGSGPELFCCPPRLVLSVDTFSTFLSQSCPPLCAHLSLSDSIHSFSKGPTSFTPLFCANHCSSWCASNLPLHCLAVIFPRNVHSASPYFCPTY